MQKTLINNKTLFMVDELLTNLANEGRNFEKTRARVKEAINSPRIYAISSGGDVQRNEVLTEIHRLGYRPINEQQHISRIGFNTVGIIFGNWICWSNEAFEDLGFTIVEAEEFLKNPKSFIKRATP